MTQLSKIDDDEAVALAQARLAGLLEEDDGDKKKRRMIRRQGIDEQIRNGDYNLETIRQEKRARTELNVVVEHIDPEFYDTYEGDWCRYCGARVASAFNRGPWGSRMLCTTHYVHWFTKKSLTFAEHPVAQPGQ